ncbi:MAG: ATP-binding cassette domain-containing protein, partial [Spirochaetaceae bacterium]|nr:ATP-binding cassette domain-containing protein [Spirochaetaceae bacterium]
MAFIQLDGIGLSFADRRIFSEVHLTISPGSRIALTGANGSGKSTLMKVAAGLMEWDEGRVIRPKGTRVAYLPQSGIVHKGSTLLDEAMEAFEEL